MKFNNCSPVFLVIASLAIFITGVLGQAQYSDSSTNINFGLETIQNGSSTDLHMQLSGSTSNPWTAIGIGSQMRGALMFIMYPSASRNAVTVSVRTASGHSMPSVLNGINYAIQQSSISGNTMTADIMCYGCTSWSGGSLDVSSTRQPWIYAIGSSSDQDLASDDVSARINQHSREGGFSIDMTVAMRSTNGANSSNSGSSGNTGNSGSGSSSSGSGTSSSETGTSSSSSSSSSSSTDMLLLAHAGLLITAFVGIMPLGAIALRAPWKLGFISHWLFQLTGAILAFAGLGVAIAFSLQSGAPLNEFSLNHQIIGIVAISLIAFQSLGGFLHHLGFKKTGKRSFISWAHMILGRAIIILGMANAILGFNLVENRTGQIAVGVVSLIMLIITEAVTFIFRRRSKTSSRSSYEPKLRRTSQSPPRQFGEPPQYS